MFFVTVQTARKEAYWRATMEMWVLWEVISA